MLAQKRMAPDGTEIHIYNQHLYENSIASGELPSQRPKKKKLPRFGKNSGQARLGFRVESSSQKSNMLVPNSDMTSMVDVDDVIDYDTGMLNDQPNSMNDVRPKLDEANEDGKSGSSVMKFDDGPNEDANMD